MAQIAPEGTGADLSNHLIINPHTSCPCGYCIYYSAVCGHHYQMKPHYYGKLTSPTLKAIFCKTPAPRHQ